MKPHVDTTTGKIFGCKKGSFKWLHEKGHLEFNSNPKTSWLLMKKSYIFDLWMLFTMGAIAYRVLYTFSVITWSLYIFITIYEEWWCNEYAKKHFRKKK